MRAIEEFVASFPESGTRRNYKSALRKFIAWKINQPTKGKRCSPNEDILFEKFADEYIHSPQEYTRDILGFISFCGMEKNPPKSTKNRVSIVKSWLEYYDIPVNNLKIKRKLPKGNGQNDESIPEADIIKKMVSHTNFKTKFLILFLVSTGFRINEALSIRLSDIAEKDGIGIVKLKGGSSKTGIARTVFLTTEVVDLLHIWVERERQSYLESSNGRRKIFLKNQKPDLLFPFHQSTADKMLETTLKHAGMLKFYDDKTVDGRKKKTIHFHIFRKFFITTCAINGMPDSVRLSIEGHQRGMDQIYVQVPEQTKICEFKKIVPKLTILQDLETLKERDEWKEKYIQKDGNMQVLFDDMKRMRLEIENLHKTIEGVSIEASDKDAWEKAPAGSNVIVKITRKEVID
jgi:integrase